MGPQAGVPLHLLFFFFVYYVLLVWFGRREDGSGRRRRCSAGSGSGLDAWVLGWGGWVGIGRLGGSSASDSDCDYYPPLFFYLRHVVNDACPWMDMRWIGVNDWDFGVGGGDRSGG
jgi:hypothetical protein